MLRATGEWLSKEIVPRSYPANFVYRTPPLARPAATAGRFVCRFPGNGSSISRELRDDDAHG